MINLLNKHLKCRNLTNFFKVTKNAALVTRVASKQAEKLKSPKMKDEVWKMNDESWKMKDDGWKMKDESWKMKDSGWRGFEDRKTDKRTDIFDFRVAFATEKIIELGE